MLRYSPCIEYVDNPSMEADVYGDYVLADDVTNLLALIKQQFPETQQFVDNELKRLKKKRL